MVKPKLNCAKGRDILKNFLNLINSLRSKAESDEISLGCQMKATFRDGSALAWLLKAL